MDKRTLIWLRENLRERSNRYLFKNRDRLDRYEEAVLDGRIEEVEDMIRIIDLELLGNPDPETLMKSKH